ncbi:MAG: Lin1244/Lin1753 domain-containing protein [Dehalogenimonas sp.]
MGRKQSDTVEYFPHMAKCGKTIYILETKWGNDGYAFWFRLLETLCREDGHFIDCANEAAWQFLLAKTRVTEITGSEILSLLDSLHKIDSELWQKHRIIWCQKLVDNLQPLYTRRGRHVPEKPCLNRKETDNYQQKSSSGVISEPEMHQRKGKESKGNKKEIYKEKKPLKQKYGEFENVFLSDEEYRKLKTKFPADATERIENLSAGIASKGYKYKDHYAAILAWARRDEEKTGGKQHGIPGNENSGALAEYIRNLTPSS